METRQKGHCKGARILSMFERISKGEILTKMAEAKRFGVSGKTIQRDIDEMRSYYAENHLEETASTIEYSKEKRGYLMRRDEHIWLTGKEIMGMAKILLESRAFPQNELNELLDKIIMQSLPDDRRNIKDAISNERYHYAPVKHGKKLLNVIWELGRAVQEHRLVVINYFRAGETSLILRSLEPLGIVFSEYYFYLVANQQGMNYTFPAIYRLDRIENYQVLENHFSVPYRDRFEEGEFRKRVQFMKPGKVMKIQFKFWGDSLEAVLDRLPTAKVIGMDGGKATVEAEVFGRGIKMWLLSQAEFLEVIYPIEFKEEMKLTIQNMLKNYQ